jgi:hypothetical protein
LNQPIQQNAVETAIVPMYAVSVVLVKGVHDRPPLQCQDRMVAAICGPQLWLPLDIP